MIQTIIAWILGILGLLIFVISKSIFHSLPANSEFGGVFAVLSLWGLGLIILTLPMLRCRSRTFHK
jgi:hypothetical protein